MRKEDDCPGKGDGCEHGQCGNKGDEVGASLDTDCSHDAVRNAFVFRLFGKVPQEQ